MNLLLRLLLALWVLGYLLISCAPIVGGHLGAGLLGLLFGGVFFVPWLIGVIVLGLLVALTNRRRAGPPPRGWR